MWEYLSTYSKSVDASVSWYFLHNALLFVCIQIKQSGSSGTKLYYRTDFADYMISLSERNAAVGYVSHVWILMIIIENEF